MLEIYLQQVYRTCLKQLTKLFRQGAIVVVVVVVVIVIVVAIVVVAVVIIVVERVANIITTRLVKPFALSY